MSEFKQLSRSVKGLTVLVTGAASGMGRATAHVFAAEGANVAVTDIGLEPTQAVASAITALYQIPLPPVAEGLDTFKLPVLNVGMLGGGTVVNAVPREAWFTVDLRSLDSSTQDTLETAVVNTGRRIGEQEGVGFRMEHKMGVDYVDA